MKSMKKVWSLLLAMVMVFGLSANVFAAGGQDTNAYYYQGAKETYATSTPITVYVTIESCKNSSGSSLLKTRIPVTLTPDGSQTFTVTDAFVALQSDAANDIKFLDYSEAEITGSSSYVTYVEADGVTYGPSGATAMDGWMVRINDRFAILGDNPAVGGLEGAAINTTYLSNGDDIHFYMDNTMSESACAKYTKLTPTYADGKLTVQVEESHNWFDSKSPYTWHITEFKAYTVRNATFTIYKEDEVVKTVKASGSPVSIDVALDIGETYTVVMNNAFTGSSLKYTSASAVFTA